MNTKKINKIAETLKKDCKVNIKNTIANKGEIIADFDSFLFEYCNIQTKENIKITEAFWCQTNKQATFKTDKNKLVTLDSIESLDLLIEIANILN